MPVKERSKEGTGRPTRRGDAKRGLSLYPLSFEEAVGAVLKTGPAPKAEKRKKAAKRSKD